MAFKTADGQKSYGSAYRTKKYDEFHPKSVEPTKNASEDTTTDSPEKFDAYADGKQPGETNDNEHSTSQESGADAEDVVKAHGPASEITFKHDHDNGQHTISVTHPDGHKHESVYSDAAEAYEVGGKYANTDVKKRDHYAQEGAESEEMGFEQPDLA